MPSIPRCLALSSLFAVFCLYCFPFFKDMRAGDELPKLYLTMALVDESTVAIDSGVERWGKSGSVVSTGGHDYLKTSPGASMLAIPAYMGLKMVKRATGSTPRLTEIAWTSRMFTGILPTLFFMLLLWRYLRPFAPAPETRRLLLMGYGLGSLAMTASLLSGSNQLAAVCMGTAYILSAWVVEGKLDRRWLWVAGFAGGATPIVDYQATFAVLPVAVLLIGKLAVSDRKQWRGLLYAIGGAIPPIVLLLVYQFRAFGGALRTGYSLVASMPRVGKPELSTGSQAGLDALTDSVFLTDASLLLFCPMVLLALPGWALMARRKQWWTLATTLSVVVLYMTSVSNIRLLQSGWHIGPRYTTAILPFLMVPIAVAAAWSEKCWPARALVIGFIGVGVVVYPLSAAVFPYYPIQFLNPLYELTFQLLLDGHTGPNAGWLIGLSGLASLLPYLMVLVGCFLWVAAPSLDKRKSAFLGLALCVAVISAYSLFPKNGPKAERAYRWVGTVTAHVPSNAAENSTYGARLELPND